MRSYLPVSYDGLPVRRSGGATDWKSVVRLNCHLSVVVWRTALLMAGTLYLPVPGQGSDVRFSSQIRPILAEHCLECHGPDADQRKADLRLDVQPDSESLAIVPGKPDESEFIRRIESADSDELMPPAETGKSLTAAERQLLRRWIREGAHYEGHWAFEPITRPEVPGTDDESLSEIDRFIIARLRERALQLSPRITRQQLVRRATFDLTGLPPSWDDVVSFVNDDSPEAFEKVIDRLLKSPRYGERWGRHWLDIARYADTHGGSAIGFTRFPFSYTYRDYVIAAFNADVPYDRFVSEQLAADQLGLAENDPALAGLGFLTVGMQFRNPHDTIDDQIDVVTRGLLGLTVACARCHDHKYDAVPTRDYYSLYATLASSQVPQDFPVIGKPQTDDQLPGYQKELTRRQLLRDDMALEQSAVMQGRLRMQVGMYLRELAKGTPEQDLSSAFLSYRTDDLRPLVLNRWRDYLAGLSDDDPVFGLWRRLSKVAPDGFEKQCRELIESLTKENGDPAKFQDMKRLRSNTPRWNPRVLDALTKKNPKSLLDVADAYGELFAAAYGEWLQGLLDTSLEARPDSKVVPDEDTRHLAVNSPVNRQLRHHLLAPGTPTAMSEEIATTLLNRPIRDGLRGLKGSIHNLHLTSPGSPARAMVLQEDASAQDFHVFRRGNPIDRGELVRARFLSLLTGESTKPFPDGKKRLGLARAITDEKNPLTRRVIVNWVWRHHFGRGLVRTPDDFGIRGEPPTHPELLDWLASTFLEDGWSIKQLHRRIMLTEVYQQGAVENVGFRTIDPDNRLWWRMPRRRLEMEAMRDAMLAVSGELDNRMGGRPFELLSKKIVPRRSVYAFVNRDIISSLSSTFDGADPTTCTARRPDTNVPQQTLFALNSEFIQDRAAALIAHEAIAQVALDEERIRFLYRQAFSREPDSEELTVALRFIQSEDAGPSADRWTRLAHVLLAANEFVFVD